MPDTHLETHLLFQAPASSANRVDELRVKEQRLSVNGGFVHIDSFHAVARGEAWRQLFCTAQGRSSALTWRDLRNSGCRVGYLEVTHEPQIKVQTLGNRILIARIVKSKPTAGPGVVNSPFRLQEKTRTRESSKLSCQALRRITVVRRTISAVHLSQTATGRTV